MKNKLNNTNNSGFGMSTDLRSYFIMGGNSIRYAGILVKTAIQILNKHGRFNESCPYYYCCY